MKTLIKTDLTELKTAILATLEKGQHRNGNVTEEFLYSRLPARDYEIDTALLELLVEGKVLALWQGHRRRRWKSYALPGKVNLTILWSIAGDGKTVDKLKAENLLTMADLEAQEQETEREQWAKRSAEATVAKQMAYRQKEQKLISELSDEWIRLEGSLRQSISNQADGQKGEAERAAFLTTEHTKLTRRRRQFFADNYKAHFSGREMPSEMLDQLAPLAEVQPA